MWYGDPISTVITPAASYDLTDLATAKAELCIPAADTSNDVFLSNAITRSSSMISTHCNRVFPVEDVKDVFFRQSASTERTDRRTRDHSRLDLSRWPIASVGSVVETDANGTATTLVADTDYLLDAPNGALVRLSGGVPAKWVATIITVQYDAGFADIPGDLAEACLRLVVGLFKNKGRNPLVRAQDQPGLGRQEFWVGLMPGQTGALPPEVLDIVDRYRTPNA